ncbi:MAG: IS66 family insertion sequence element accessory protein TnpB [Deltaproteobacteria bacterium]|nr:IS66 family insertion sequence element accessory protein TnpB [Deltaproteobacteria bacterium]
MDDQDKARWTKLVADYESSELTQREFASERGLSFSNLRNWIYKLRKESRPLVTEAPEVPRQAPKARVARKGSRLVPVEVVASATKSRTRVLVAAAPESLLELALPSGSRVRFPAGTDLAYLQALAAAL